MNMQSGEYWAQRFAALEKTQIKSDAELAGEIDKLYRQAQREIESKISRWYMKFAQNNEISMAEAKKLLKQGDLEEFKWSVDEYIQHGENNLDDAFTKQLVNASSKVHISRYESLLTELQATAVSLMGKQETRLTEHLKDAYSKAYRHTAYEIQKGTGVGFRLGGIDEKSLETVLKKPWAADGSKFSDRIWKDKQSLLSELDTQLKRNIILGKGPDEAAAAIAKRFETSKANAYRLIQTESAAISSKAHEDCFHDLDVEEFEIVETLDSHTCPICGAMDGKHFPMSDYAIGVTVPPFHPNCRGTTVPYYADLEGYGERFARNLDGDVFYVPADTTYEQWEKMQDEKYGAGSVDKTRKMHYNKSEDLTQYEKYKKVLGQNAPGSFEDFQKIKYQDREAWENLTCQYRTVNRYEVSGNVSPDKIIELDNAAYYTKQTGFSLTGLTGDNRRKVKNLHRSGNAAAMEFEGTIYFSHSAIGSKGTPEYDSYVGQYPIVGLKSDRLFSVKKLWDDVPREYDTEAKFLEFVAGKKKQDDVFEVTILSEKHICESCQGVLKQFKEMFPKATVNIVSGKIGYNGSAYGLKTWKYRKKVQQK